MRNKAIKSLNATSYYLDGILSVSSGEIPTEQEITTEAERIQTEYDAKEYARLRKEEYNKLNQYELQFDDLTNGTNTWEAAILEIKAKYPKGVL